MAAVRGAEIFPEKARDGDRVPRIRRSGELLRQDGRDREGRVPGKSGGDVSSLYQAAGERESLFDGVCEVWERDKAHVERVVRLLRDRVQGGGVERSEARLRVKEVEVDGGVRGSAGRDRVELVRARARRRVQDSPKKVLYFLLCDQVNRKKRTSEKGKDASLRRRESAK